MDKVQLRVAVIDDDFFIKDINKYKKEIFKNFGSLSYQRLTEMIVERFRPEYPIYYILDALKVVNNQYKRRNRCLDKTTQLIDNNKKVYFGTLTFNDETLSKTNFETRRKYVSRYLKSISNEYIANIDFGDKNKNPDSNEREHYHCLISCDTVPSAWNYGFVKFKLVRTSDTDKERLSKYIAKLTNHAMKVERTGKSRRLIYSRGASIPFWLFE